MRFDVVTLFPEAFHCAATIGITGRAVRAGMAELVCHNPRDFADDERGTVDDRPFGGGPGMVLQAETTARALESALSADTRPAAVGYMSPQGAPLDQGMVERLAKFERLILLCGRYEGIDERVIDGYVDFECAVGDFVVSGGELPAAMLVDAVIRQIPGALGKSASAQEDSFADGLLDCPHYTRPETWRDVTVPATLLSGHHGDIADWRQRQSVLRTWQRRPDLLIERRLDSAERLALREWLETYLAGRDPSINPEGGKA